MTPLHSIRAFHPNAGFLPSAIAVAAAFMVSEEHRSAALAAAGAIVTVIGVATIGRPIVRLGYNEWRKASQTIEGGHFSEEEEPPGYREEQRQQDLDAYSVQVAGPIMVVVGTLLSGFSGFA